MENNLTIPTYEFKLSKKDAKLFGISLVESPAIQSEFILMQDESFEQFQIQSEERRLITGAVMIPGMRIARYSPTLGNFHGWFSKNTIRQLVYNSVISGEFLNKFSFHHDGEEVTGLYMVESWFVDGKNDKSKSLNLNLPEDTFMMNLYVPDVEQFAKIKEKGVKGFSIEIKTEFLELERTDFKKQNFCTITYRDVIKAKLAKGILEKNLDVELMNKSEVDLEKWNSECPCSNCNELSKLKWNLPGVLPEGVKEFKKIQ